MIPKIIHYVWVGGNPLTPLAEKCIESWKKYCPDYEIKRWDETNFDINENRFCREAYECKKWAFVSDYIRLKVLHEHGGIYMDTDVEVVKPLDPYLNHKAFSGFECSLKIPTGIIAAEKNNAWIKLMLDYYNDRPFILENGHLENMPNVIMMTERTVEKYSIQLDNTFQDLGDIVFYPYDVFCPNPKGDGFFETTDSTVTIHHFAGSWLPKKFIKRKKRKEKIRKLLKNIGILSIYRKLFKKNNKTKNKMYSDLKNEKIENKSEKIENKFTIVMPTYNDCETIEESLKSIVEQDYKKWELIIVNDGSTDDTEIVVNNFIKNNNIEDKVKFYTQENSDQLHAINNVLDKIEGDIVYILHSDDVFYNSHVLSNANNVFQNTDLEMIMNKKIPTFSDNVENITGYLNVRKYINKNNSLKRLMLNLGQNIYVDVAFIKKDVFIEKVKYNYLTWNRPFWANIEDNHVLIGKNVNFYFFKYRVFEQNYINSDTGKLVQFNGELRTLTDLSAQYYIPAIKVQSFIFRAFSKFKMSSLYNVVAKQRKSTKKETCVYVEKLIDRKFKNFECINNDFVQAVKKFYSSDSERVLDLSDTNIDDVITGADIRKFVKHPENYKTVLMLIEEMKKGFNKIKIQKQNVEALENILHFLCIKNYVEIEIV